MPFKIRTKLTVAFVGIILSIIFVVGGIAYYNQRALHKAIQCSEDADERMQLVNIFQLALGRVLMPGNEYIITGDRKYVSEFETASYGMENGIKMVEESMARLRGSLNAGEMKEEEEIFRDVKLAWQNIKDISLKIFAIPDPARDKTSAKLMEEMDYKWAYPAVKKLDRLNEITGKAYREGIEAVYKVWRRSWFIMGGGALFLSAFGVFFAFIYSRLFTRPIETIHYRADAIAKGDFKTRLDIRTGDELQQLAGAMNEMAAQLDSFYGTLERQVEERTRELRESEEKLRLHAEIERNMAEAVYLIRVSDGVIVYTNPFFERLFGYEPGELVGKHVSIVNAPGDKSSEAVANEIISILMRTGVWNGEVHNIRKDGTTFWCHANVFTFEHPQHGRVWLSMHQDITDKKKAEEKIKEQLDYLERFQKVAVKREFRIKELRDRVDELEKRIVELGG